MSADSNRLAHLLSQMPDLRPEALRPLPDLFEDSSHQIWCYDDGEGCEVIKVLNTSSLKSGPFWLGMRALFGVDLPQQMGAFERLYPRVAQATALRIPRVHQLVLKPSIGFWAVRTDCLPGQAVIPDCVTTEMVVQLARHLAGLHRVRWDTFEAMAHPVLNRTNHQAWSKRLKGWLEQQATPENGVSLAERKTLLAECEQALQPNFDAGPLGLIMPDLRWDQFLQQDGRLTGLTDLDALVAGPVALDWVLIELLLDKKQFDDFCNEYQKTAVIPKISAVRVPYRAALFLMNVFGETNYQAWQKRPIWLD